MGQMKRTWRSGLPLLTGLVALAWSAGSAWGQAQPPVKIGLLYTESGPLAQLGIDMRDGFLQYWSEVGNRVGGRAINVLSEGHGTNKADEGLTKARKLVERDGIHLLTGIIETPIAYALRSYVIEKKLPLMILNAGADGLTQKQRSEYIFRSSFSNSDGSHPLGEWAYKQGYRKMVLIATDFAAGHEHIGGVARTFIEAGGQVIQEIYPTIGTADYAPYVAQIRRDADVVAAAIFGADALRFVVQYAEFGLKGKIPLIGKGGLTNEEILPKQGEAALGIITAFPWTAALDTPVNKRFVQAYEARYKRPATQFAEHAYVGAAMLRQALEAVGGNVENQEAFLAALRKVEVDGPRGKVRLDAFQNPIHTIYINRVERKGGELWNVPVASYPNVSQFWKWSPEAFQAMPGYVEMKGKWAK